MWLYWLCGFSGKGEGVLTCRLSGHHIWMVPFLSQSFSLGYLSGGRRRQREREGQTAQAIIGTGMRVRFCHVFMVIIFQPVTYLPISHEFHRHCAHKTVKLVAIFRISTSPRSPVSVMFKIHLFKHTIKHPFKNLSKPELDDPERTSLAQSF